VSTMPPGYQTALPRAALVRIAADGTRQSIPFQYVPESLRRTLEPNTVGGEPGLRAQAVRFAGAPAEVITLDCQFTAADGLNAGNADAGRYGVEAALAALALLLYPSTASVQAAQSLLSAGQIEVAPSLADRILFVWGPRRVIPCTVTAFSVTEQLYDSCLTVIMASASLTLRAMSYSDVDASSPTFHDFITYQSGLETLAHAAYAPPPAGLDA
jgi:hypothetical protein